MAPSSGTKQVCVTLMLLFVSLCLLSAYDVYTHFDLAGDYGAASNARFVDEIEQQQQHRN